MSFQSDESLLSVVIVNSNTRDLLRACLFSVEAASKPLGRDSVEIIVVDNGSADGSVEMVRQEFGRRVSLVANHRNLGLAAGINRGLRLASSRYVLLLNPDTELRPALLQTMVSFLETHPDVGAMGPRLLNPDGTLQLSCYPAPTLFREIWRLFHLDRLYPVASYPVRKWSSDRPHPVETIEGACILIRSSVLQDIGLLDEKFSVFTEEIDFCRRACSSGWNLYWLPTATAVRRCPRDDEQVPAKTFIQLYRSKLQYFRKHNGAIGGFLYKLILLAAILPRITVAPLALPFYSVKRAKLRSVSRLYALLLLELKTL